MPVGFSRPLAHQRWDVPIGATYAARNRATRHKYRHCVALGQGGRWLLLTRDHCPMRRARGHTPAPCGSGTPIS